MALLVPKRFFFIVGKGRGWGVLTIEKRSVCAWVWIVDEWPVHGFVAGSLPDRVALGLNDRTDVGYGRHTH